MILVTTGVPGSLHQDEPAQADPFYAIRALAEQGATQNVYGVLKRFGGVGSEVWDYFDGPVDYVEPNK